MEDLVFDFAHTQSIIDRLQNLKEKTIKAIDCQAYTYNECVNLFFDYHGSSGVQDVRMIVMDYIDLSTETTVDADGTYRSIASRPSNPILELLTRKINIYTQWMISEKRNLKFSFELERTRATIDNRERLKEINQLIDNLNKRKIVWYSNLQMPVYEEPSEEEPDFIFDAISQVSNILASPFIYPYSVLTDRYRTQLVTLDISKIIPRNVSEYRQLSSTSF